MPIASVWIKSWICSPLCLASCWQMKIWHWQSAFLCYREHFSVWCAELITFWSYLWYYNQILVGIEKVISKLVFHLEIWFLLWACEIEDSDMILHLLDAHLLNTNMEGLYQARWVTRSPSTDQGCALNREDGWWKPISESGRHNLPNLFRPFEGKPRILSLMLKAFSETRFD